MSGGTFLLSKAYAAAGVVVADGAVSATVNPKLLSSATAAWKRFDQGKTIVVAGAGAAGADLTTKIKTVLSATVVELADPALTTVVGANLSYVVGVYRLRDLLREGDVDGNKYDLLSALGVQIQVNSLSPGKIYIGGPNVTPTNAGEELIAPGSLDDDSGGRTFDDFVCADADASLLNILWAES